MRNIFMILVVLVLFTSCDPLQSLEIVNQTSEQASAKFFFKPSQSYEIHGEIISDSLVVNLEAGDSEFYDFGLGTWKVLNQIDSLIAKLDRIELISVNKHAIYEGEKEIGPFLNSGFQDRNKAALMIFIE